MQLIPNQQPNQHKGTNMDNPSWAPFGLDEDGVAMNYCDTDDWEFEQRRDMYKSIPDEHRHTLDEEVKSHAWAYADSIEERVILEAQFELLNNLRKVPLADLHEFMEDMMSRLDKEIELSDDDDLQNTFPAFSERFINLEEED